MPAQLKLKTEGLEALKQAMAAAGDRWRELGTEIVTETTQLMHAEAQARAPVGVTTNLRAGLTTRVGFEGAPDTGRILGQVFVEGPGAVYAPVMELGRRAGAKQPPSSALELWVRRKLGVARDKAKSVAYVVARSIGKKGIKGRKFFEKAAAKGEQAIVGITRRRMEEFLRRFES